MDVARKADRGVEIDEAELAAEGDGALGRGVEGCGGVGGEFVHCDGEAEVCEGRFGCAGWLVGDAGAVGEGVAVIVLVEPRVVARHGGGQVCVSWGDQRLSRRVGW